MSGAALVKRSSSRAAPLPSLSDPVLSTRQRGRASRYGDTNGGTMSSGTVASLSFTRGSCLDASFIMVGLLILTDRVCRRWSVATGVSRVALLDRSPKVGPPGRLHRGFGRRSSCTCASTRGARSGSGDLWAITKSSLWLSFGGPAGWRLRSSPSRRCATRSCGSASAGPLAVGRYPGLDLWL